MAGTGRFRRRWADGPWLTGGYRRRMWPGPQGAASGGVVQRQQPGLGLGHLRAQRGLAGAQLRGIRPEEHTSELQSLMRISYAVFSLKNKKHEQCTKNNVTS